MQPTTTDAVAMPRVTLEMNHETGEGRMLVPDDATSEEISTARDQVEAAGWETIDAEESGDPHDYADDGRMIVPLFMPGHPAL